MKASYRNIVGSVVRPATPPTGDGCITLYVIGGTSEDCIEVYLYIADLTFRLRLDM